MNGFGRLLYGMLLQMLYRYLCVIAYVDIDIKIATVHTHTQLNTTGKKENLPLDITTTKTIIQSYNSWITVPLKKRTILLNEKTI